MRVPINLFILDTDLTRNAQFHVDKHVVKMPLEAAQIAATVLREMHGIDTRYKSTHKHHPCVKWAAQNGANLMWVVEYGLSLCAEYTHRYGKTHGCAIVLEDMWMMRGMAVPFETTPAAQAMPDEFKRPGDAVAAYRAYYIGAKQHIATWRGRPTPEWFVPAQKA